jgi:hypothetical protein
MLCKPPPAHTFAYTCTYIKMSLFTYYISVEGSIWFHFLYDKSICNLQFPYNIQGIFSVAMDRLSYTTGQI